SNGYYIDRMLSVEHHYSIDPIGNVKLTKEERKRILGGEATMWSELVTPLTIDSRIWPRTAAIAERFWSPKTINNIDNMLHRLKDVNNKLEELGITHIKNRAVILRNISNHSDNEALKTLSRLCEPLKVYTRNKGGTEYKSFSPFTLFADACVADAEEATAFNKLIARENGITENNLAEIKNYLKKWATNYEGLTPIIKNPNIKPLEPLSKNLSLTSTLILKSINNKKITQEDLQTLFVSIKALQEPYADVELAITDAFKTLIKYCKTNYSIH
ncbi:family 20 glycosylhydrolase, partial [Pontimicrobium sp. MEBiC01747]